MMGGIAAEQVTAGYHAKQPVLRDISLTVAPGQLLAVTGASGAGKTTLLRTLAGLLRPSAGRLIQDGRVVFVPQHQALAPVLTAAENVLVALVSAGQSAAAARQATEQALQLLDLQDQADQLVEELSGGQQQRAALARGLAMQGDVLLADEVTSELDAASRAKVLQLLRAEADRGAAVVFATHDPQAAATCDAQLHLVDGFVDAHPLEDLATAMASTTAIAVPVSQ